MNDDVKELLIAQTEFHVALGSQFGHRSIAIAICVMAVAIVRSSVKIALAIIELARAVKK